MGRTQHLLIWEVHSQLISRSQSLPFSYQDRRKSGPACRLIVCLLWAPELACLVLSAYVGSSVPISGRQEVGEFLMTQIDREISHKATAKGHHMTYPLIFSQRPCRYYCLSMNQRLTFPGATLQGPNQVPFLPRRKR